MEEVSAVSGQFDYLAFLRCASHERLDSLLDQIGQMEACTKRDQHRAQPQDRPAQCVMNAIDSIATGAYQ